MTTSIDSDEIPAVYRYGAAGLRVLAREGRPDVAEVFIGEFEGRNASPIEFVDGLDTRHPREKKWIINVSTQFGCPIGCVFCDAGGDYRGNLDGEEMLVQALFIASRHPGETETCRKLKIHFARMGEPALNDAVPETIARLPEIFRNPNLWCCVPTTAPAGRESWFERLREVKETFFHGRFQLQFSVNSTDETQRVRMMPARLWRMEEIARFGGRFFRPGDRRIVINFALADGVAFDPEEIRRNFDPGIFAVKLTPVNPTRRGEQHGLRTVLRASAANVRVEQACSELEDSGFDVILSVGDGREDEIGSNCGQAVLRLHGECKTETQPRIPHFAMSAMPDKNGDIRQPSASSCKRD